MAPFFMYMPSCRLLTVLIAVVSAGAQVVPRPPARSTAAAPVVRPATWSEVAPIVERLSGALPSDLRDAAAADRPARWQSWAQAHRQALTARLAAGDLDSVVNLLLFGTSFTSQPR